MASNERVLSLSTGGQGRLKGLRGKTQSWRTASIPEELPVGKEKLKMDNRGRKLKLIHPQAVIWSQMPGGNG